MAGSAAVVGIVLFVGACILIVLSILTDVWIEIGPLTTGVTFSEGLWKICLYFDGEKACLNSEGKHYSNPQFLYGARACMISACICAMIALLCTLSLCIDEKRKGRMVAIAIMHATTGLLVLLGTTWFAIGHRNQSENTSFGFSFILGWVSVAVAFASGFLIIIQAYRDK